MNKQFEEYVIDNYNGTLVNKCHLALYMDNDKSLSSLVYWDDLPFAFQWGVYLYFFDSVGIEVASNRESYLNNDGFAWDVGQLVEVMNSKVKIYDGVEGTRPEAQKEAIKKAFEILEQ